MSKPFDATLKELIASYPVDWLTQLGVPVTTTPEILSADLSTVSAAADTLMIFNKVIAMQESGTYQLILEEGAIKHTRELILRLGRKQIGEPTEKQQNKLNTIDDLERLDRMAEKILTVKSWDVLLRVK